MAPKRKTSKPKPQRFTVDGVETSYADVGSAMSRSITCAERATEPGTWYVRDSIGDVICGYSEAYFDKGVHVTRTQYTEYGKKVAR